MSTGFLIVWGLYFCVFSFHLHCRVMLAHIPLFFASLLSTYLKDSTHSYAREPLALNETGSSRTLNKTAYLYYTRTIHTTYMSAAGCSDEFAFCYGITSLRSFWPLDCKLEKTWDHVCFCLSLFYHQQPQDLLHKICSVYFQSMYQCRCMYMCTYACVIYKKKLLIVRA